MKEMTRSDLVNEVKETAEEISKRECQLNWHEYGCGCCGPYKGEYRSCDMGGCCSDGIETCCYYMPEADRKDLIASDIKKQQDNIEHLEKLLKQLKKALA